MSASTSTTVIPPPATHTGEGLQPPRGIVHDSLVVARRGLKHLKRQPEALSDATIQPIMFVLLFAYVFGGAIDIPGGGNYREFLMGGIFAQTIVFSAFGVAMSLANDRKNQVVDRFRSLPISTGAILGGHALTNLVKALLPILLMSLCGLAIGWRLRSGIADALLGYALLVAFAFAMVWIGVLLGSLVATPEGVQGIAFGVLFPITFIASTFVPTATMPGVLRTIAEWNPVTTLADAVRIQFGNPNTPPAPGDPWSIAHPLAYSWIWIIGIIVVCAPIAVRIYKRSIAK
jgi:ABC-type polysaccharide/polyol phosphate export permease